LASAPPTFPNFALFNQVGHEIKR
jgi:hypothetical protein